MKLDQKKMMIVGGVLLVLFVFFGYRFFAGQKPKVNTDDQAAPSDMVFPTVDSSVKVDLISTKKGEAILSVNNAPSGTESIEFEMSYLVINEDTGDGGGTVSQGAIGKCYEVKSIWECGEPSASGRKIILGTCSSGVCRYHNISGPIRISLKFSGSYGNKMFTKEYEL